jgi:hypothetical protein
MQIPRLASVKVKVILPRFHIIPRFERGEPLEQSEAVD